VESTNNIQQIMIPLLIKAGIHFDTEYIRDRVLFIGQLEARIAKSPITKEQQAATFYP
jgi:hypothetical protein